MEKIRPILMIVPVLAYGLLSDCRRPDSDDVDEMLEAMGGYVFVLP